MFTELTFLPPLLAILSWITAVDYRRFVIPDSAVIALFLLGTVHEVLLEKGELLILLLGSLGGATAIYAFRRLYYKFKGIQGIGLGDVKLMGAIGMWIKPLDLPLMLLLSCLAALSHVLILSMFGKTFGRMTRLPFGPYLCFGMAVVWGTGLFL